MANHRGSRAPQIQNNAYRLPDIWENILTWKKSKQTGKQREREGREEKEQNSREIETMQKTKCDLQFFKNLMYEISKETYWFMKPEKEQDVIYLFF